jgi:predicted heme/steroid binding protein
LNPILSPLCAFPTLPLADLAPFTGEDGRPIYVAADGFVFLIDGSGIQFYGPGCGYSIFAGRYVT